jgi:predicted dehydrogenase
MGISIGMVGLGSFGSGFVDLFKSHPLVDRIAFSDIEENRARRFAESDFMNHKFDPADAYGSLNDICNSDLDALVITTQPWLHAPQAIQVMKSGKSVFSAVPISCVPDGTEILDWCDRIINTVKTTGKHYMLGETSYYHPETMFLRRQAAKGMFGTFISANSEYAHDYSGAWGNDLREVWWNRVGSTIGAQWPEILKKEYLDKGIMSGPMHYPTHSVAGPVSIMKAHARKVSAIGTRPGEYDNYFDITGHFSHAGYDAHCGRPPPAGL